MQHDDLYFVNPWVDALFVGALSLVVFAWFELTQTGYGAQQVSESAIWISTALAWVGNWPHVTATSWRLYESRARWQQFPLTAWLIPLLVLLATVCAFLYPVSFAPTFIKLFVLWSPYHYSAQTLGITLIYARRAGLPVSPLARRAFTAFFLTTFLTQYAETEIGLGTAFMYSMSYPQLKLPSWTPAACHAGVWLSMLVLAYELLPQLRQARRLPWIVALPLVTQYLWFVFGARSFSFQLLVPFFHAFQYVLIAWSMEMHSRGRGGLVNALFGSARWAALNFVAGGLVFFGLPRLLELRGWNLELSVMLVTAGASLHHFFVDGVIWKLKREGTRSPLFVNVGWALGGKENA